MEPSKSIDTNVRNPLNVKGKINYRSELDVKIFPVTYFHLNIPDNKMLKDNLSDKIVKDSENLPIPEGWTTTCLRTSFDGEPRGKEIFFGEDNTYQKLLEERYGRAIRSVFDAPFQIAIDELWYNVYTDGEWQEEHDHIGGPWGAHFSCIHFLSYDRKRHVPVRFKDPMAQIRNLGIELDRNDYDEVWEPNIYEGDLLMFPSWLVHSVRPGPPTPDYPRITIAFNFRVLEYEGDKI